MSVIGNLFEDLTSKTKTLPSAKERRGIRVLAPEGATEMASNNLTAYQENPDIVSNIMSRDLQQDAEGLAGKDLNLFALNGPESLSDYLDSDAITGAGVDELNDLSSQLELGDSPGIGGSLNSLWSLPLALSNLEHPNVTNGISAVSKLARLYAMLPK